MTTSSGSQAEAETLLGGTRMPPPAETQQLPLRFIKHAFEARCYNTIGCQVDYDNTRQAGPPEGEDPDNYRAPPPKADHKAMMDASYIGIRNFIPPADVRWKSLDGVQHEAKVDIGQIFKDQLAWHKVSGSDYAKDSFADSVDIFLEVNDRTINVYTKAFVATRSEQEAGNKHSNFRDDLFLVWTRTY